MKGKEFIDTNVLIYAKLEDDSDKRKREIAVDIIRRIQDRPIISIQVLNEFAAVLIKHAIPGDTIYQAIK
jgi:predicted nucleic acid-binding protein